MEEPKEEQKSILMSPPTTDTTDSPPKSEKDLLALSAEDGAEEGAGWPIPVKVAAALLALVLYLYCVVFVCTLYQRTQQLHHIDDLSRELQSMIADLHTIDHDLYKKIQLLQEDDTTATATATAMSTEVETAMTAMTSTTY